MNLPKATISPRSRRRTVGSNAGGAARSADDPRVAVLIELPWVAQGQPEAISSHATAAADAADDSVATTVSLPPLADLASIAELPPLRAHSPVAAAPSAGRDIRIDEPHAAAPAPHTAHPGWKPISQPKAKPLSRRPAFWLTWMMASVLLAFVLLRGNKSGDEPATGMPEGSESASSGQLDSPISDKSVENTASRAKRPLPERVAAKPSRRSRTDSADASPDHDYQTGLSRQVTNTPAALEGRFQGAESLGPSLVNPNESAEPEEQFFEMADEPPTMPDSPLGDTNARSARGGSGYPRAASLTGEVKNLH